jgi:dienelactone hydrolase
MEFPLAWRHFVKQEHDALGVPGSTEGGPPAVRSIAGEPPAVPFEAFAAWRAAGRARYLASLQDRPPVAPFHVRVLATERRDGYEARKLALNLSADTRVKAYLLVPDGPGPFPAVVALHDHGAHFTIGKEKVVLPFDEPEDRVQDSQEWVNKYYGGRWFGDELAKRGYVVFATDAMFWGDRGRAEGADHSAQQALASNMFQLGMSWAGTIVWDDVRSAEFVQGLAEVDPERVACMGLSMGANRSWHLASATDIVKAGAAICWLGDTPALMREGNNQTVGQSAFSMLHPGLRNSLDYADVASLACPKPMLFYNGDQDSLFPIPGVEAAYATLRDVWQSQDAGERLETRIWPVPHEFNLEMQDAAFAWLDRWMPPGRP